MKIKFLLFLFVCITGTNAQSQEMFSFISDKMFTDPSDLVGYNFVPNFMEIPDETDGELDAGEYSFGVTQNNLYVKGEEIGGVYSLNNINPTQYGFKLMLMNARDPRIQGHLKIILNKYSQVDALVFKRSGRDKEIIFYNAELPEGDFMTEKDYFTDRWETELVYQDSLWGMKVKPFFRIHTRDKTQERLEMSDSTTIQFIEKITIIDKTKKKKKKKKGAEEAEVTEAVDLENIEMGAVEEMTEEEKKKIKIIKKHYVEVRSIMKYSDGETEDKTWTYEVKEMKQREDTSAGPNGERYQLELSTNKEPLYLYLTKDKTISSFEMEGFRYLMQGF